ncbi:response regulator receiver protein [[Leptolyngbya] sp. PCC 7376]|nr:response regulator receiver protein [[Leptolyngbya] sp. PCC 7376]
MEKTSILIVDDKPENLHLLSDVLLAEDYVVRQAINGNMALKSVVFEQPDIILLDIKMPGMDGFELCFRLKELPKTKDIPVIFLSAQDDVVSKLKAFDIGGVDYITKPFRFQEVLIRVSRQIEAKKQQKELNSCHKKIEELETLTNILADKLEQARLLLEKAGIREIAL